MKLMVASDIHGSEFFCRKLYEAWERENPDRLILLGDILYHGPRNDLPKDYSPRGVADILNGISENILCVRGNCDADVDGLMLSFPIFAPYAMILLENRVIHAVHGHDFGKEKSPVTSLDDIVLSGHTHVPEFKKCETGIFLNPGSVSIPKENSPHSYMILSESDAVWKTLDGKAFKEQTL